MEKVGRVSGILEAMPEATKIETIVEIMVAEALKTSEIEGEFPNRIDVLSSIRKNLGIHTNVKHIKDKSAIGLGQLMIDVRTSFKEKLTQKKLFEWHSLLLSTSKNIRVGSWRKGKEPMQIISGAIGKETIHFEAPPSADVPSEMKQFIQWFNDTAPGGEKEILQAPVRSAVAHLYFESIHPFEDGNGRIGRAIAEKALSQTIGRPVVLSLSRTIEANKKDYYKALQITQSTNDITNWITYFVKTVLAAQTQAEAMIEFTLKKGKFFSIFQNQLNVRQTIVVNRMLQEGPEGFLGGMNARKYMSITKSSKATSTRDLQNLVELGVFAPIGEKRGKSTSYELVM